MRLWIIITAIVLLPAAWAAGKSEVAAPGVQQVTPHQHPPSSLSPESKNDKSSPNILSQITGLMSGAGQGLAKGDSGKPVQVQQAQAIDLLKRVIAAIEKQQQQQKQQQKKKSGCKKCAGKGCKSCGGGAKGNEPPSSPADKSQLTSGDSKIGKLRRAERVRPGETWGNLRPAEREKILQSLQKQFPSRYRPLVEQYYEQLGKER